MHLVWQSNVSAFFFFPFIFTSWRLITLQYCSGFCHTLTWISHGFTCVPHPNLPLPPPSPSHPSGSSQCTNPEHPSHASNLGWWSVSPLIVGEGEGGMFRENSIETCIYLGWNRSPAQVGCMRQVLRVGALGRPRGMGWRGRREGGSG